MRVYKTIQQLINQEIDVRCDICGRSCRGQYGNFCGIQFTISGGPDSPVFADDESVKKYQICEYCTDEWMKSWPQTEIRQTA